MKFFMRRKITIYLGIGGGGLLRKPGFLTTMDTRVFSQWAQWLLLRFLLIRVPFEGHNGEPFGLFDAYGFLRNRQVVVKQADICKQVKIDPIK